MPLLFHGASTDQVSIPNSASIQTLASGTVGLLINPVDIANSARTVIQKADNHIGAAGWSVNRTAASGAKWLFKLVATSSLSVDTGNTMVAGVWQWLFYTWVAIGTAPFAYRAVLGSPVIDVSNSATGGSGSQSSDAALSLEFGKRGTDVTADAMPQTLAWVGLWNRALSLTELRNQQIHLRPTWGCVGFWFPGENGTGSVIDRSGRTQNNGTLTGAVPTSDVVPHAWRQGAM